MTLKTNIGIYKIYNMISGYFYIGSAVNLKRRWKEHKQYLNQNTHKNIHLQNAWNKYGPDAFTFLHIEYTTLEALTPIWSEKHQCKVILPEQFWLDKYWGTGLLYNICSIASSTKGYKHSEETKKKISESHKGQISTFKGKHHSKESKKKLSDSHKGIFDGKNNPNYGKHASTETLKKMSESQKGHKCSEETRKKMSQLRRGRIPCNKGKIHSEETKLKISNSLKWRSCDFK